MERKSRNTLILELAEELVSDIELSRLTGEALLLKATRLARLTENERIQSWLHLEMIGYNNTDAVAISYLDQTGRWINRKTNSAYWGPLAQQEAAIQALTLRLRGLRIPDITYSVSSANPNELVSLGSHTASNSVKSVIEESRALGNALSTISAIRSRVIGLIHSFATSAYYRAYFSDLSESIFQQFQDRVNLLLADRCGDVLKKVPAVYRRLVEGDSESVSQALTTCRRILEAFADAVYPAPATPVETDFDGKPLRIGKQENLNRIEAYVRTRLKSDSRRKKIRQTLENLNVRLSSAVHGDVSPHEAMTLFLETYVILGEILSIPSADDAEHLLANPS